MMDLVLAIGTIIAVNIAAWLMPGPNMLAVITASLTLGRTHGLATGFGLACGAFIWATLAVLGVAILFDLFPKAVIAIKLAGAAYLVWLGLKSIRAARKRNDAMSLPKAHERSLKRSFKSGFIVTMTNPKAGLCCTNRVKGALPLSPDGLMLRAQ